MEPVRRHTYERRHDLTGLLGAVATTGLLGLADCTGSTPFVGRRLEERAIPLEGAETLTIDTDIGEVSVTSVDRDDIHLDIVKQSSSIRLLGVDLEGRTALSGHRRRDRLRSLLADRKTWTALLYLAAKFVLGIVSLSLVTTGLSTATSMMLVPLYYDLPGLYVGLVPSRAPEFHPTLYVGWNYPLVGIETVVTVGSVRITTLPQALVVAGAGVGLFLTILHAVNGLARVWGRVAQLLLAGGYDPFALVRSGDDSSY